MHILLHTSANTKAIEIERANLDKRNMSETMITRVHNITKNILNPWGCLYEALLQKWKPKPTCCLTIMLYFVRLHQNWLYKTSTGQQITNQWCIITSNGSSQVEVWEFIKSPASKNVQSLIVVYICPRPLNN